MSRPSNPMALHTALGIVLLILVLVLMPAGTDWWRRVLAGIFSITLGHQIATAILSAKLSRVRAAKAWLESISFLFLIASTLFLPTPFGWMLLITGVLWRPMVGSLWK